MTASRSDEEALFNSARLIGDGPTRAQYLWEACGGDESLLRRVEALLAVHEAPDRLLDRPAVAGGVTGGCGPAIGDETAHFRPHECAGTVIGPYRLLQQIGEGGMGTVFMAEQTKPVQRKVALKLIKAGLDNRQVVARFEAERQALAIMDHVNIARVLDAGATESGLPYFVMELVHGVPITKYCDDNHLTPRQRLELFVPVCQAIQHAHQKGIIHRDIKPSNVMVTLYDGKPVPKVIDFGVAKATEQRLTERTLFTQYGTMVGTLEYMSPEQAEMSALGIDTRSDIYSLGVLLYELLTGSTPLNHKRVKEAAYGEILRLIKEEEPQKPSTRLGDSGDALASISALRHTEPAKLTKLVRGELDWIVMKTLEKDRGRRYETASGFAADVQRYLRDEPVEACPPSTAYRMRKFLRKHRAGGLTAAGLLGVLLLGAVVSGWLAIRATAAEAETRDALGQAEAGRDRAFAAERRANETTNEANRNAHLAFRRAYGADVLLADLSWRDNRIGRVRELLDNTRPERTGGHEFRNFEWHHLDRRCHADLLTIPVEKHAEQVAFSHDGSAVAWVEFGGDVVVWNLPDNRERFRVKPKPGATLAYFDCLAFSPDGKWLAAGGGDGNVSLCDPSTGQVRRDLQGHGSNVTCLAFSPDSKWLVSGSHEGDPGKARPAALVREVSTGKVAVRLEGLANGSITSVAFRSDGSGLAAVVSEDSIRLWDLPGGQEVWRQPLSGFVPLEVKPPTLFTPSPSLAFSPDGKVLGCAVRSAVKLLDAGSGREIASFDGHQSDVTSLAFHPAGDEAVSSSADRTVRLWTWSGRQTTEVALFRAHEDRVNAVAFSPDGRHLASAGNDWTVKLWDSRSPTGEWRTPAVPKGESQHHAYTADGKQFVLATKNRLQWWDLAAGQKIRTAKVQMEHWRQLVADPGGELLALVDPNPPMMLADHKPHRRFSARVVDAVTGKDRFVCPDNFWRLTLSEDGKRLVATVGADEVKVVDLATGREVSSVKLGKGTGGSLALSRDGRWLARGMEKGPSVRLWDLRSGEDFRILHPAALSDVEGVGPPRLAFSPDGRHLATGWNQVIIVWDIPDGRERSAFWGHSLRSRGNLIPMWNILGPTLAWRPDGSRIASVGADKRLRLWDAWTGQEVFSDREDFQATSIQVSFSPDGAWLWASGLMLDARPRSDDDRVAQEARCLYHHLVSQGVCLRKDLLGAIGKDPSIGAAVRRQAELMAQRHEEDPTELSEAAAHLATHPDLTTECYLQGLRNAEAACSREPNRAEHLSALGACQYRLGGYPQALQTLTQADHLRRTVGLSAPKAMLAALDLGLLLAARPVPAPLLLEYSDPTDLAYLAMTRHRLGQKDHARAALIRLRSQAPLIDLPPGETHPLIGEDEKLIRGKGGK